MEYKTAQHTISQLARYIKYLSLLLVISLACNLSQSFLLWHQSGNEKTILVPENFSQISIVSDQGVDANYLLQSALFFVDARLNVTPDTVDASDKLVLSHTASEYYSTFNGLLSNESSLIKTQKISSAFYISNTQADPKKLTVTVTGTLKRWVAERSLSDAKKTYELHFRLNGTVLFLTTFQEIEENKRD
ncbi:MAG: type IV conjugative transfer system protein TraE [Gammaproteobacteria bacterium RIFCSPHIGHO2_02_FULL_39_13]|nr:MAG: type IV conjugative transfer system protein TraE [Gammaproteobacteria bacterium RIFCSPHIGHO2_02_FULL_39_13]